MRNVYAFALSNAVVMPNSMIVLDRSNKIHHPGAENIGDVRNLASYDWHFVTDGLDVSLSDAFDTALCESDTIVSPICGPGFPNYGHFLFDGLPGILLMRAVIGPKLQPCGQRLTFWQAEILHILGLLDSYVTLERPSRFNKVVTTSMLSLHLRDPTPFCRAVYDTIRFNVRPLKEEGSRKILLSRGLSQKRLCINRSEVESLAAHMGFQVLHTDGMSVADQVRAMRDARVIVGEGGAGMANIGFCLPGARVLEINVLQDPWIRSTCFHLGHRYYGFFPRVNAQKPDGTVDWDGAQFHIDLHEFEKALDVVLDGI